MGLNISLSLPVFEALRSGPWQLAHNKFPRHNLNVISGLRLGHEYLRCKLFGSCLNLLWILFDEKNESLLFDKVRFSSILLTNIICILTSQDVQGLVSGTLFWEGYYLNPSARKHIYNNNSLIFLILSFSFMYLSLKRIFFSNTNYSYTEAPLLNYQTDTNQKI